MEWSLLPSLGWPFNEENEFSSINGQLVICFDSIQAEQPLIPFPILQLINKEKVN